MSDTRRYLYLICYDISDDRRLRRVYKLMRGHGERIQYSVFRCVLSAIQLARLKDRLGQVIHVREDQILIIPLGDASKRRAWRAEALGRPLPEPSRHVRIL